MKTRLAVTMPAKPQQPELQKAHTILSNSYEAASSFLGLFEEIRRVRKAHGTPTDAEQDLLRAMLVFASAGLDEMVKQLVRDALPAVIDRSEGAQAQFAEAIHRMVGRGDARNMDLLIRALARKDSRRALIDEFVQDLTSGSLQSVDELLRVAAAFDIPSPDIVRNPKVLRTVFQVRNQIAHEMDIDFTQPNRRRRPRARDAMIAHTQTILGTASAFLAEAGKKL